MRKNGIVNKYEYVKEKITMDNKEKALLCHKEWNGKLETVAKSKVKTREDLAIAYTPEISEIFASFPSGVQINRILILTLAEPFSRPGCCRTLQSNCGR